MDADAATDLVDGKYSVRDLIDLEKMRGIFERFTHATGVTIAFLDHPGMHPLIAAEQRDSRPVDPGRCPAPCESLEHNSRLLDGMNAPGEVILEARDNGLADCATPVIVNGKHIASLVTGRFLLREPDGETSRKCAGLCGSGEAEYLEALKKFPVVSEEKAREMTTALGALASLISEQGYYRARLTEKSEKLERLVASNEAAESALRTSEAKYRDLTEAAPDLVWETDESGVCTYINPRLGELLGYEAGEVLGKSPAVFLAEDAGETTAKDLGRCLLDKAPFRNIGHAGRHKDGRLLALESSGKPCFDGTGAYRGHKVITRDISARKRLEAENELKALLLDSVNDAVFLHDLSGRIVYVNEAACVQHGYTQEEMLRMMYQQLLTPESSEDFVDRMQAALNSGDAVYETDYLRKGGILPVEIHARTIELDGEKFILRVVRDITARKETENEQRRLIKELERTNAEISQFNSLIAHDLQAPLRLVAGYAQQLRKRLAGKLNPAAEDFLGYITNGAGLMQEMLDGLLHYLREGAKPEALREVDMDKVAGQALLLLKPAIEENGAAVSCGRLPVVAADRSQMLHLLQNLIGNAVKFRGLEAPRVSVSCAAGETEHVFTVRDNGIGIPPQALERVFKIFQRLHTREKYPGTGLGLALCRKIVENHGGRIWAESGPGKGTAFHFTLPKRDRPRAAIT